MKKLIGIIALISFVGVLFSFPFIEETPAIWTNDFAEFIGPIFFFIYFLVSFWSLLEFTFKDN